MVIKLTISTVVTLKLTLCLSMTGPHKQQRLTGGFLYLEMLFLFWVRTFGYRWL